MSTYLGKFFMALVAAALLIAAPGCKKDQYTLNFSHTRHVVENKIECSACHSASAGTMSRPDHGVCSECHEIDEDNPSTECLICHKVKNPDQIEVRYPEQPETAEIIFSHKDHDYMSAECQDCHTRATASASAKENILPSMEACLDCHDDKTAPRKDCSTCHVESSPVNGTHKLDWEFHHGIESKAGNSNCLACHSEDTCIECHQDTPPRDHNNSWRKITHGAEAGWNRSRCMTCHQEDFCDRCHRSTRPRSHKTSAWSSGPTLHCSQCHFPTGTAGCSVCHAEADHPTAPPTPSVPDHSDPIFDDCRSCHFPGSSIKDPGHPDFGLDCEICHER